MATTPKDPNTDSEAMRKEEDKATTFTPAQKEGSISSRSLEEAAVIGDGPNSTELKKHDKIEGTGEKSLITKAREDVISRAEKETLDLTAKAKKTSKTSPKSPK